MNKKITLVITLLFVAAIFVACTKNVESKVNTTDAKLTMATHGYSALHSRTATSSKGYYETVMSAVGGFNIAYTDFATGKQIYLCNSVQCEHSDESCPSYFAQSYSPEQLIINSNENKLICFARQSIDGEDAGIMVFSMNEDGSDRVELTKLLPGTALNGHILISNKNVIYTMAYVPAKKENELKQMLISINTISGETNDIKQFNSNERIESVKDSYIYLSKWADGNKYKVCKFNISDNTISEILEYETQMKADTGVPAVFSESTVYLWNVIDNNLQKIDMDTGEKTTINENIGEMVDTSAGAYFVDMLDNHIFIQTFKLDGDIDVKNWYAVSLENGKISKQEMEFKNKGNNAVAYPIAEFEKYFLVTYDAKTITLVIKGTGDTPYEVESNIYVHGIMLKEDFYNNIKNIQEIESIY